MIFGSVNTFFQLEGSVHFIQTSEWPIGRELTNKRAVFIDHCVACIALCYFYI